MEQVNDRYSAPPTTIHSYLDEYIVECPKCQHSAVATTEKADSYAKLTCNHCNYSEKGDDLVRYKVSIREDCDNCGSLISKVIPNSKEEVDGFAIQCLKCGETRLYLAKNEEYARPYTYGSDPVFHLPLWFQESVKGNLFWAYNRRHLQNIKQYVIAKLRERQTLSYTTMVEKLPSFIKEAKNRETILKAIERMERK